MLLNKKLSLISTLVILCAISVNAQDLEDVTHPKPPAYRVGLSEIPETQFVQAQQTEKVEQKYTQLNGTRENNIADRTYADLSIKNLSREVAQDLEFEEQEMLADLSLLWQGAAMQSDTINFALYKLANPDADKPDEKSIKNVLKTIASMSTLVGASMGNPIIAGSSLIGGNIFGIMAQDTKALNYKYTRVTDADMIILIRKIEDLQQNAVNLYYDYMSAKKHLDFTTKLVDENRNKYELAQKNNASRELVVITDAYYRTALDKQRTAKAEFFAKRAALEQFVGHDTFVQFEEELLARENGESKGAGVNEGVNSENETTVSADTDVQPDDKTENTPIMNPEPIESPVIENVDDNLIEIPKLRPIETDMGDVFEFGKFDEFMTGLASNAEDIVDEEFSTVKNTKKDNSKKLQKQEKKAQAKAKKSEEKQKLEDITLRPKEPMLNENKKTDDAKLLAKEKKLEEKRRLEEKRKDPMKGLIFLHAQDKTSVTSGNQSTQNAQTPVNSTQRQIDTSNLAPLEPVVQNMPTPTPNPFGLPPLDEIRVPDLTRGGYSIHSELSY